MPLKKRPKHDRLNSTVSEIARKHTVVRQKDALFHVAPCYVISIWFFHGKTELHSSKLFFSDPGWIKQLRIQLYSEQLSEIESQDFRPLSVWRHWNCSRFYSWYSSQSMRFGFVCHLISFIKQVYFFLNKGETTWQIYCFQVLSISNVGQVWKQSVAYGLSVFFSCCSLITFIDFIYFVLFHSCMTWS